MKSKQTVATTLHRKEDGDVAQQPEVQEGKFSIPQGAKVSEVGKYISKVEAFEMIVVVSDLLSEYSTFPLYPLKVRVPVKAGLKDLSQWHGKTFVHHQVCLGTEKESSLLLHCGNCFSFKLFY